MSDLSAEAKALLALRKMKGRLEELQRERREPIAVVGLALRFPGADDPDALWAILAEGRDAVTEVPGDRWDVDAYFDPDPTAAGKMTSRWGGFVRDIDRFDGAFFGITPREAQAMDPQQRLVLEVAWHAFEDAGIVPASLSGSPVGIYLGITGQDYREFFGVDSDQYAASGASNGFAAGRLAYVLDLRGPTLMVDTLCSSSLVTTHLACQALRARECDVALSAGVNAIVSPSSTIAISRMNALSPRGRCRAFDAGADGFVRSEGCSVLVLERVSDAIAKGRRIRALVLGSAVNSDGRSQGLTAPNAVAQSALVKAALERAGVEPGEVDLLEAHGTGTALGDPIEVDALRAVFGPREDRRPLYLGAVKANLGHMESAAGMGGLCKVILSLQHEVIPPIALFESLNPKIELGDSPLKVPTAAVPWPRGARRRVAGVSSFGMSGTNAHIVLGEAPAPEPMAASDVPERPLHALAITAQSPTALATLAARYADLVERASLPQVAAAAHARRAVLRHGAVVVAADGPCAARSLRAFAAGERPAEVTLVTRGSGRPKVAFLFTGQGSQYTGMGRALYDQEPAFREVIDRCAAALPGIPLIDVIRGAAEPERVNRTAVTQPALFALEVAVAAVWKRWGVEPDAVIGHSVGELAAAHVAGVLSLEDGLKLIAERGRLMDALPDGGAMAAIFAPEARVREAMGAASGLSIAAVNGPTETVISGDADAVEAVVARLEAEEVKLRRLVVSHAFHSARMDPMLDAFERVAASVAYRPPDRDVISNLSGAFAAPADLVSARYWREHVRRPVRFADGLKALYDAGYRTFVEVGPDPRLSGMGMRIVDDEAVQFLPSLRRDADAFGQMLSALGGLHASGVRVDWSAYEGGQTWPPVDLPLYPFDRTRHWASGARQERTTVAGQAASAAEETATPALRAALAGVTGARRRDQVVRHLKQEVGRIVGQAADAVDANMGLFDSGMDSMMAVELQRVLQGQTGLTLPKTLAFDYPTIIRIADYLVNALGDDGPAAAAPTRTRAAGVHPVLSAQDLAALGDAELDRLVRAELALLETP